MAGRFPPGAYTDFVGRQDELAGIAGMLADRRLVTIVGPGGVGKTRVSLVVAAQAAARYPDGPWIVEELHQQPAGGARDQLGAERYDAEYETGAAYVRRLLDATAAGGALRLEIP